MTRGRRPPAAIPSGPSTVVLERMLAAADSRATRAERENRDLRRLLAAIVARAEGGRVKITDPELAAVPPLVIASATGPLVGVEIRVARAGEVLAGQASPAGFDKAAGW